jgi:sensor domain CHASE-containing protein
MSIEENNLLLLATKLKNEASLNEVVEFLEGINYQTTNYRKEIEELKEKLKDAKTQLKILIKKNHKPSIGLLKNMLNHLETKQY